MYQEWFEEFEEMKKINNEIKKIKNKTKALGEIQKTAQKYNLELTRQDNKLIIKGIFE